MMVGGLLESLFIFCIYFWFSGPPFSLIMQNYIGVCWNCSSAASWCRFEPPPVFLVKKEKRMSSLSFPLWKRVCVLYDYEVLTFSRKIEPFLQGGQNTNDFFSDNCNVNNHMLIDIIILKLPLSSFVFLINL